MSDRKAVKMTMSELEQHQEAYDGLCLACGEWTTGGVEPDARRYKCPACQELAVYGAEELIFRDDVTIEED